MKLRLFVTIEMHESMWGFRLELVSLNKWLFEDVENI